MTANEIFVVGVLFQMWASIEAQTAKTRIGTVLVLMLRAMGVIGVVASMFGVVAP